MATATDLMTAEEFATRPDPGYPEELVQGRIVTMPPATPRHGKVCGETHFLLRSHAGPHDLGHVLSNDSAVITERDPDTVRGADVSFYSYAKIPKGKFPRGYLDVVPDLVVEVRSDDDRWREILAKVMNIWTPGSVSSSCSTPIRSGRMSSGPIRLRASWAPTTS